MGCGASKIAKEVDQPKPKQDIVKNGQCDSTTGKQTTNVEKKTEVSSSVTRQTNESPKTAITGVAAAADLRQKPATPRDAANLEVNSPSSSMPPKLEDLPSPKYEELIPLKVEHIHEMREKMLAADAFSQLVGVISLRKLLCTSPPPIDEVLAAESGMVVDRLIVLMQDGDERVQFEAAWCVTNIASGTSPHTHAVVDSGAIAVFAHLCSAPSQKLRDQAVWALGNIAGDPDTRCRDEVLRHNVLSPILEHTRVFLALPALPPAPPPSPGVPPPSPGPHAPSLLSQDLQYLHHATWALTNLCRGNPPPEINLMKEALPVLISMLKHWDLQVQADGAWGLSYLSAGSNDRIQHFLTAGPPLNTIGPFLSADMKVATPILRYIGNLVAGEEDHTQAVMDAGLLPHLLQAFQCQSNKAVHKEIMWTLSNCMAGTPDQIQSVLDSGLVPSMVACISGSTELEVKKEAVWAFGNAAEGGRIDQKQFLVDCGCVKPLCEILECEDDSVSLVVLTALCGLIQHEEVTSPAPIISSQVMDTLVAHNTFDRVRALAKVHAEDPTYSDKAAELLEVETVVLAEQEVAAIKIQAVQRGKAARKQVEQKIEHKQQDEAAVKIQAIQRGKVARKEVKELKIQKDTNKVEGKDTVTISKKLYPETEVAAVKIQAIQFGKEVDAMKESNEQQEAAVKIQAIQRGNAARREVGTMNIKQNNAEGTKKKLASVKVELEVSPSLAIDTVSVKFKVV